MSTPATRRSERKRAVNTRIADLDSSPTQRTQTASKKRKAGQQDFALAALNVNISRRLVVPAPLVPVVDRRPRKKTFLKQRRTQIMRHLRMKKMRTRNLPSSSYPISPLGRILLQSQMNTQTAKYQKDTATEVSMPTQSFVVEIGHTM